MTAGWGETEVLLDVSSRRLAPVQHRHLPARGLLSLFSLLRGFLLNAIKRNQAAQDRVDEQRVSGADGCFRLALAPRRGAPRIELRFDLRVDVAQPQPPRPSPIAAGNNYCAQSSDMAGTK